MPIVNAVEHNDAGVVLHKQGKIDQALAAYQRAIALQPLYAAAHFNLGNAWKDKRRLDLAIASFHRAAAINPAFTEAHTNLGIALFQAGQIDAGIASFHRAVSINPRFPEACFNLGRAYAGIGRTEEAVTWYRRTIALDSGSVMAHNNLGTALAELGNNDEAIESCRAAIAVQPDFAGSHYNLAHGLLRTGQFTEGWKEYEWRWDCPGRPSRRGFSQPLWDGADLPGKTILLSSEQGLGDHIHFFRYAQLVARRCRRVVLECPEELLPLRDGIPGVDKAVQLGRPLPPFDAHVPLLSVPGILGTTLATIPADVPYIKPDPARIAEWAKKLTPSNNVKVGLVWAGRPDNSVDTRRSCSLREFAPLASATRVDFYSLQKGPASSQAASPPMGMKLIDLTPDLHNFADTAALIANLDLVISVDTAVAHLAGAMARPVWTLLPFCPDWRWLLDRSDSPWYPTMRLFRQPAIGAWSAVMKTVAAALGEYVNGIIPP